MSAKKKPTENDEPQKPKEKKNLSFADATAFLLKKAEADSKKDPTAMEGLTLASDVVKAWKYTDFCDITVKEKRPFLPFEYFFGTRGLLNGRVVKIDADEATGKSSLVYLLYGMTQRTQESFIQHHEAESAPMPPDRIAALGCDPMRLFQGEPGGVDDCIAKMEEFVATIRAVNQDNSIIFGIDSISGLAQQGMDLETGAVDGEGNQGLAYHSRAFSKFFRERLKYFATQNAIILAVGQNKQQFKKTGFGQVASGTTAIADGTFKFTSSWMIDMASRNLEDNCAQIECTMTKNKLASKNRKISMFLYRDKRGWDLNKATLSYLSNIDLSFKEKVKIGKELVAIGGGNGGWYKHMEIQGGKNLKGPDFLDEFFARPDLILKCREVMEVRGFGFGFEKDLKVIKDDDELDEEELKAQSEAFVKAAKAKTPAAVIAAEKHEEGS